MHHLTLFTHVPLNVALWIPGWSNILLFGRKPTVLIKNFLKDQNCIKFLKDFYLQKKCHNFLPTFVLYFNLLVDYMCQYDSSCNYLHITEETIILAGDGHLDLHDQRWWKYLDKIWYTTCKHFSEGQNELNFRLSPQQTQLLPPSLTNLQAM